MRCRAVKCLVYLKKIGADPYQKGIDFSLDSVAQWSLVSCFHSSLEKDEWDDEKWLGTTEYEFAKEMWTKFARPPSTTCRKKFAAI